MSKTITARVEVIKPLTDSILQLFLQPETFIDYKAGQYLQILFGKDALSYSIANAPLGAHHYELHLRHSKDNLLSQALIAEIRKTGSVRLQLPFGDCCLDNLDKDKPILFIAGGTGFAPVKAMIEQLLTETDSRPFQLFWGARSESDLYMDEKVMAWQKHVSHFQYFSSVSLRGKSTLPELILAKHAHDLKKWQIVISGPFDMVYAIRDILLESGLSKEQLFSDAFGFEQKIK